MKVKTKTTPIEGTDKDPPATTSLPTPGDSPKKSSRDSTKMNTKLSFEKSSSKDRKSTSPEAGDRGSGPGEGGKSPSPRRRIQRTGSPGRKSSESGASMRSKSGKSQKSRSQKHSASPDQKTEPEQLPYVYTENAVGRYMEAMTWAKDKVLKNEMTCFTASRACSDKWNVQVSTEALRLATRAALWPGMTKNPERFRGKSDHEDLRLFCSAVAPNHFLTRGPVTPMRTRSAPVDVSALVKSLPSTRPFTPQLYSRSARHYL